MLLERLPTIALTLSVRVSNLKLSPDAMAGYLAELAQVHSMLDSRYDQIKSGGVEPIDGEEAFERLRRKSENRRRS
jgi:hypothetical protein